MEEPANSPVPDRPERIERPRVEAMEKLLGVALPVLDQGFVRLVDYMGSDESIVQAARVSYGKGTKKVHEDRGLIRYLMRHHHTTPLEMCELKLHIRIPMDAWRQWIRHRTACLAEGTEVYFDLPSGIRKRGNQLYKLKIEDIWNRFQRTQNIHRTDKQRNPYFRRDRIRSMQLRQVNEETLTLQRTRVVDIYKNGRKPVFRMTLADGKSIDCTADHRFLFASGWSTLHDAVGLQERKGNAIWNSNDSFLYVNGAALRLPALYQDREWLNRQYNELGVKIEDIAVACGASYHTVRKWLRVYGIQHPKGGRSKPAWNRGKTYDLGPRSLSQAWIEANRRSRSGPASNFWKGGISTGREGIGRWTTQIAVKIHTRNGWTCQLCHQRAGELHTHHIVPVWADPSRARFEENLTTLCAPCHRSVHGKELEFVAKLGGPPVQAAWKKKPRVPWNKLTVARLVRIERFEYLGKKMTYDLEVEGPHHNFIANGIVTHNSVNEYSTRYSIAIDAAQKTPPGEWRSQAINNRQGSGEFFPVEVGKRLTEKETEIHELTRRHYEDLVKLGVAREQARKDLPLSTYTEAYWKIDLHNLLHFLWLRMDEHAQLEIREFAKAIGHKIVSQWVPQTWEAFQDYRVKSMSLTRLDIEAIAAFQRGGAEAMKKYLADAGLLSSGPEGIKKNREREEMEEKLRRLGLPILWK